MAEPRSKFTQDSLNYIAHNARRADEVARILGISPTAVIGAVANEYDTRFNPELKWSRTGGFRQLLADAHAWETAANPRGHKFLERNYEDVKAGGRNPFSKYGNPVMIDVGPGNIRIETAIDLLKEYQAEHPDDGDDPLNLKKYHGHYDKLVLDLLDFDKSDTSMAVAGLMMQKADAFFRSKDAAAWSRRSPDEQDALRVMYYKMGPDTLSRNIDQRINGASVEQVFDFDPVGDGGAQHLNNIDEINAALKRGRFIGPSLPESYEGPKEVMNKPWWGLQQFPGTQSNGAPDAYGQGTNKSPGSKPAPRPDEEFRSSPDHFGLWDQLFPDRLSLRDAHLRWFE